MLLVFSLFGSTTGTSITAKINHKGFATNWHFADWSWIAATGRNSQRKPNGNNKSMPAATTTWDCQQVAMGGELLLEQ